MQKALWIVINREGPKTAGPYSAFGVEPMTDLPCVVQAEYCGQYRIKVTFNDGSEKIIDFLGWLEGPIFEPLKDVTYFQRFFIDGGTVVWPNGADIAPETLYEAQAVDEAA
jgi:hypothetical protein